jgi:putative glutamine amidotransferase
MGRQKPLIGVTGPDRGGLAAWFFTRFALWRAGGRGIHITPSRPHDITGLDGLIIGGGADVDPSLYGEEREHFLDEIHQKNKPFTWYLTRLIFFPLLFLIRKIFSTKSFFRMDRKRDELENGLISEAYRRRLPVLGICRGAQLINVFLGGSLHQNIVDFYIETPQVRTVLPKVNVIIEPGSKLAGILKSHECTVNALHRQAVDNLGSGLEVVAREANGITQGIEHRHYPYLIGVQWHPEYLPQQKEQLAIFLALVEASGRGRGIRQQTGQGAGRPPAP